MYAAFYNLSGKPFQIDTDPRFLWLSEKHQEALANLKYGLVDGNGPVVLIGDIGTGKTTLVNALLDSLDDKVSVAKINHTSLEPDEFLFLIAKIFDPDVVVSGKSDLLLFFNSFLKKEHADGKTVLLIVDEAHRLSAKIMEEIRLLTNIEQAGKSLLSVIFVGQQELRPILQSPQCRALRQRIALFYNIEALTGEETALYVQHRLRVAGTNEPLFSSAAITRIHRYTKGCPRMINILCDRALLTGYVKGAHLVDEAIITECARELDLLRKRSMPLFQTALSRVRSSCVFLPMHAAKAGAKMKSRIKRAIDDFGSGCARWHGKGGIFTKNVFSRSGRIMVCHRRSIAMGLAASVATLIFAAWTLQAFSVADGQEQSVVLKRPKPDVAEPAPASGDQEQKAASPHKDRPTTDAAEFTSMSSKPGALPEVTTAEEKILTDQDPAPAPNLFSPVQATPQQQAETAPAEDNFNQVIEQVDAKGDGGLQLQDNLDWPYARALMGRADEIKMQSSADAEQLLPEAKTRSFSHKVKWPQETLYAIALWYTGSGQHWRQIAAANPAIAPDQIHIGNAIAIPLSLIKTRMPMPSDFLKSRKKSRQTPALTQPSAPATPPPLFGSIDHPPRSTPLHGGRLLETLETFE
jgi:type II secretory pathway predicted ATPase ExeA